LAYTPDVSPIQPVGITLVLYSRLAEQATNNAGSASFRVRIVQTMLRCQPFDKGYRHAWAERAKAVGYPERFAKEALGHNSKAVHRAYAKKALMRIPSLEDYEQRAAMKTAPTV
jgi:integrase